MRWFVVLGLVSACTSPAASLEHIHDACAPLAVHAPSSMPALAQAYLLWRDFGAPELGVPGGDTIELTVQTAAPAFHGLYDDASGTIFINADLVEDPALAIVLAHELGHAMGLPHVSGRPSVMISGNTTIAPTDGDRDALTAIWGACAPPGS